MLYWLVKIITCIPFSILFPCIVKGKRNIPKGKVIFVCNHLSNIDYIYLYNNIWRRQYVLAKQELFKNKFVAWFFRKCGGIPVDRKSISLSTIKTSLAVLKHNKILTIFPEATRNKKNLELQEFKAGASVFAVKTGSPIIPIIIKKRPHFFAFNKIIIGKPIYFDELFKGDDGSNKANEIIKQKMIELKDK